MSTQSFDPPCVLITHRSVSKDEYPRNICKKSPMLRKPVAVAEEEMRQRKMWPVLCCVRNVFSCFRVFLAVLRSCPHVHLTEIRSPVTGSGASESVSRSLTHRSAHRRLRDTRTSKHAQRREDKGLNPHELSANHHHHHPYYRGLILEPI